ncbi:AraC family transcriptional regulator [Parahaliea mediterranea]|uniref:AraC family transcriptional regulator n=1 Tax=Parahaliea mediterranea TaxID=651086 RepID=A0A939DEZ7_9GAMM|nr:AraC family transcriptional regulator [Parahaliea mediterranea]MBN7796272.1 AraC family transcriptional regulator [Parahaliea mediterranea]
MRDLSISVYFARAVLQNTVRMGLEPAELLRRNRISPRLLQEENARISIERFADLQVSTMLAMQDESLGYASRRLPIGSWAMMCHAVIGSETLGQALSRYCRFFQLFDSAPCPALEEDEDSLTVRLDDRGQARVAAPYLSELLLFNSHRFACWLVQEQLPIQVVRLNYPMAAQAADYRHMFYGYPVEFEQAESALVLPKGIAGRRINQNEQSLRHFLRHPVLIMLTQNYARSSWTARARQQIARNMLAMPELPEVAARLELHPQTLRRRLSAEGTTFKDIKNQVRRDTALHLLGKQGLSIEEIAHRSGFSESSAFIRAFKGWTGVTPYSYRKGL